MTRRGQTRTRFGVSVGVLGAIVGAASVLAPASQARQKYATAEEKPCGYCHRRERGGGARNYRGAFYAANRNSFAGFEDAVEAKLAGAEIGPDPLPPPKSYTPKPKIELPPDTPDPAGVPDFGVAIFAGIEFVKIPAGTFRQGTTPDQRAELAKIGSWTRMNSDEMPVRSVTITRPFFVSKSEIRQKQWETLARIALPDDSSLRKNPSAFKGDDLPVESVAWDDVQTFVRALTQKLGNKARFRLPTEAEWEYAARAGSDGVWALGDDKQPITVARLKEYATFSENSGRKTHNAAARRPNAFGIHDMLGNVWEWCADPYDPVAYAKSKTVRDPINRPAVVAERVIRGGSWYLDARAQRPALRGGALPTAKSQYIGFRLVREL